VTVQEFVAELPGEASWPVVQSTFALHTLPPAERSAVLAELRPRVGLLAIAEFSVPDLPPGSPGHLRFLAETYERGLAEYGPDRDLVAQGFLMPVLAGQLAPGAVRATWEQPSRAWQQQLEQAGYTGVAIAPLQDYWSSPAFLLTARGAGRPGPRT
jgi:hypothetical protein